jgi:hypothetical protein
VAAVSVNGFGAHATAGGVVQIYNREAAMSVPMFTCIRRNAVLLWIDGRDVVVSPIPTSFYAKREVVLDGVTYRMKS